MRSPHAASCPKVTGSAVLAESFSVRAGDVMLLVRRSSTRDLAAAAVMLRRCSAHSLMGRYRLGGQAPAALALDRQLREPLSFVVTAPGGGSSAPGAVIATAVVEPDGEHGSESARLGVLVEDSWQRQGIGRELVRHAAGAAALAGFTELISYSGTGTGAVQGMLIDVGATRYVPDPSGGHLHTVLSPQAIQGLGPIRAGRFVWADHGLTAARSALRPA